MKCFISAPSGAPLEGLRGALARLNVEYVFAEEATVPFGAPWSDWLRSEMSSSDLVVVMLPGKEPDPAAFMVEIGAALGLGKPLVVIVPTERSVPSDLLGIEYIRASPDDADTIAFHLRAAMNRLPPDRDWNAKARRSPVQPELGVWLERALTELEGDNEQARHLEETVEELFRRSGAFVQGSPTQNRDGGPDLAVVFNEPSPIAGALLVEVKRITNAAQIEAAQRQLQSYVFERGAALGVVFYWGEKRVQRQAPTVPLLLAIDLADLAGQLREQSLAHILAVARNRAIHAM